MANPPIPYGPGGPSRSGGEGRQAGPRAAPPLGPLPPVTAGRGGSGSSGSSDRWILALAFLVAGLLLALGIVAVRLLLTQAEDKPVPAVVGDDLTSAEAALADEGFEVEVRRTANVAAKDRILGQLPDSSSEASDGSTVNLTVSSGPGKGLIPDVAELPEPRAKAALRAAGLVAKARQEFSRGVATGDAIRTQPTAGARLDKGSRVTLIVSKGPQTVAVPEVVGDAEAAAKGSVKRVGLRIEITQRRSNQSPGNVLSQSPRPASVVMLGSVVEVVVDKAPSPVQVPSVQGKPVEDAVASLSDLGFAVFFRTKGGGATGKADKVLRQQPAAGEKVDPGTRVVLEVAGAAPPAPAAP